MDNGDLLKMTMLPVLVERQYVPAHVYAIDDEDEQPQPRPEPWYQKIINFKTNDEYPANATKREKMALRRLAAQYMLDNGQLLKKTPHGIPLVCIDALEGNRIIRDVHEGDCGAHVIPAYSAKRSYDSTSIGTPWKQTASSS